MAKFKYVAKKPGGGKTKGSVEADTENEALSTLRRENLIVISIKKDVGGKEIKLFGSKGTKEPRARVKSKDLVVFTRQLSTMMSSGISLLECLEVLSEQVEDRGFSAVIKHVVEDIRAGADLSESLQKYPKIFSNIYINMIKAGEASGQLDTILDRLAGYQESAMKLRGEIKSAMTYPVISITLVIAITLFLMIGIIPKFEKIFVSLNVKLPAITQFVLALSRFIKTKMIIWAPLCIGIVVAFILWKKTESGRRQWDYIKLKIPIFGELMRKVAISRFARTFATLIQSGVDILNALNIVGKTSGNIVIEEALVDCAETVREGEALSTPLGRYPVFPPMVVRMIGIGEKSGSLETLLEKISDFYEQEVSQTVESLTSLIEPIMISFMGVLVGGMVVAIFLPIFKVQESLRNK